MAVRASHTTPSLDSLTHSENERTTNVKRGWELYPWWEDAFRINHERTVENFSVLFVGVLVFEGQTATARANQNE
jgi:hypothetical protein